ncbi:MAG: glycosyltransferase [Acidimicrobiales bacterium]
MRAPRSLIGFVVTTALAGVVNGAAHRATAGRLDADAYGAFAALLAAVTSLGVVLTGLQLALVLRLPGTDADRQARAWWRPAFGGGLALGACIAVTGTLATPGAFGPRLLLAAAVGIYAVAAVVGLVPQAVLLRNGRLGAVGGALVVGAVTKLAAGIAVPAGGVPGSVAALILAELATLGATLVAVRAGTGTAAGRPSHPPSGTSRAKLGREVVLGVAGVAGLWLVGGFDAVLARLLLDPLEADAYATAGALARAGFFVPAAAALVTFLGVLRTPSSRTGRRRVLRSGLVVTTALASIPTAIVLAAPGPVTRLVTGGNPVDVGALRLLVVAWALLALAYLLVLFLMATGSRLALVPWAALPVIAIGAGSAPHTPRGLAATVLIAAVVVLACLGAPALARTRPVTRARLADPIDTTRPHDPTAPIAVGDVAVVVPFFNPGQAVATTLRGLDRTLAATGCSYEIIAVADGCTDGSPDLVDRIGLASVRMLRFPLNRGKGAAVRAGMAASSARYIGYLDADGDIDPALVLRLLAAIEASDADIVLGSKRHPDSVVHIATVRRFWSWGYQRLVRLLFRLDVGDTQTGIKLLRGEVVDDLLGSMVEDRFAFDLELFVLARDRGHTAWVEVPVFLGHKELSTVSWRAVVRTLGDTVRIFGRLTIALGYDRTADPTGAAQSPLLGDPDPAAGRSSPPLRSGATR